MIEYLLVTKIQTGFSEFLQIMHERSLVEYQNTDKKFAINYILNASSAGKQPQIKQTASAFHLYVLHFIIPKARVGLFLFFLFWKTPSNFPFFKC